MAILFAGTALSDFTVNGQVGNSGGNLAPLALEGLGASSSSAPVPAAWTDLSAYQNDVWVSFYVYCASGIQAGNHVAFFDTAVSTSQPIFTFEITTTGVRPMAVKAWNGTTLTALATASGFFPLNVLTRFDIHIKRADSGGVADVYLNGTLQFTFSGDTNLFTCSGINRIQFTKFTSGSSTNDISAIIIADEDTRCMLFAALRPVATGGVQQWAGVVANINESGSADDTTLIAESTLDEVSTFTKTALPASYSGLSIPAVVVSARGQANTGYDVAAAFRIGGVNYQSTDFNMTPAYKPNQAIVTQNPATSSAWTFSAVDGAEVGVKLIAG